MTELSDTLRLSICSELFSLVDGMDFYQTVDAVAALGKATGLKVDIELAPFTEGKPVTKIDHQERLKRRDHLRERGVRVSGLHWVLAGGDEIFGPDASYIPRGPHITRSNPKQRRLTAEYAAKVCNYARDLRRAETISEDNPLVAVWGSPNQRNLAPNSDHTRAEKYASEVFARILNKKDNSVTIALERLVNINRPFGETNFCYDMSSVGQVIGLTRERTFHTRMMRSMLDVKAAVLSDDDPLKVLENPNIIYHVHVQDPFSFGPPGWNENGEFLGPGHYDFEPLVKRLVEINKGGNYICMSMEPFDNPPKLFFTRTGLKPFDAFKASLGYMKGLIEKAA